MSIHAQSRRGFRSYGTTAAFQKASPPPPPPPPLLPYLSYDLRPRPDTVPRRIALPEECPKKIVSSATRSCAEGSPLVDGAIVDSCASFLHQCTKAEDLAAGRCVHFVLLELGLLSCKEVRNRMLHMYAKCGALMEARAMLETADSPGISAYECILVAYSRHKQGKHGLTILHEMQRKEMVPSRFILVTLLSSFSSKEGDEEYDGDAARCIRFVHIFIECCGYGRDVIVATAIVSMYGKCGTLKEAKLVFDNMADKNVISWTSLMATYAQQNLTEDALCLFRRMETEGIPANHYTVSSILSSLVGEDELNEGKRIHARIGFQADLLLKTSIVSMYSRCGSIEDARNVFDEMPEKSLVTWTAMVAAYAERGNDEEALYLYEKMHTEGISPNKFAFVSVLHMCTSVGLPITGMRVHADAVHSGCEQDLVVSNAVLDFYGKCVAVADADRIFDRMLHRDVVSWTSIVSAFAAGGQSREAFELFMQMELEGVLPNGITFIGLLSGCNSLAWGRVVHCRIVCRQLDADDAIGAALVDMYRLCNSPENANRVLDELLQPERDVVAWNISMARCDCLEDVWGVFSTMPYQDEVSWNTLISAYVCHGYFKEALGFFQAMLMQGCIPTKYTLVSMLESCWNLPSLISGKRMHVVILSSGLGGDTTMGNAATQMYCRCGCIRDACHTFEEIEAPDVVSWSGMIAGYAQNGYGERAIALLRRMQMQGTFPNEVTLVNILCACSHAGLVHESTYIFLSLSRTDRGARIPLVFDHYNCMVDLFGRIGRLAEAEQMILNMPFQPTSTMWMTLLSACKTHNDIGCAQQAARHLSELDPFNATACIVSYNIYKSAEQFS